MKPYFAKFLPTEGEITKNCKTFDSKGMLQTLSDNPVLNKLKDWKLAKLYLCSRDIKVGDKVKSFNYPEHEAREVINLRTSKKLVGRKDYSEIYILADIQYPNEVSTATVSNFFKVIGEISPNAVWITEDMEFEKDEIEQVSEIYTWDIEYIEKEHRIENKEEFTDRFQKFFNKNLSLTHDLFEIIYFYTDENNCDYADIKVIKKEYKIKCPTCKIFH